MPATTEMPNLPEMTSCPSCGDLNQCPCGTSERVLRAHISGTAPNPLSPEQKEWCLCEIASVEGYSRKDYENLPDAQIARGVLDAWRDYCQDKGLL